MEYFLVFIPLILNNAVIVLTQNINEINNANKSSCENQICFRKCCPIDEAVNENKSCVPFSSSRELFSEIPIYNKNIKEKDVVGKLSDFKMLGGWFFDESFYENSDSLPISFDLVFLTEDGMLYLETLNTGDDLKWSKVTNEKFCVDYTVNDKNSKPYFQYWLLIEEQSEEEYNFTWNIIAETISSICLLLVLIVYSLFPELRNLGGLIIMGYVLSWLVSFLMLIVIGTVEPTVTSCLFTVFLLYFSVISSFCWMNVMSFDIWWTFSGYVNARSRRKACRFSVYCTYGYGVPLIMTIGLALLDTYDSYINIPGFIAPKLLAYECFLAGLQKMLYLYTPMLIMIIFNWVLFFITVIKLIRFHYVNAVLDGSSNQSVAHRTLKNRLVLYFKLSVVMGLSWVLEVISYLIPDTKFFYISDAYNILNGVWIFLIFVCKKKIYIKLVKKFKGNNLNSTNSDRKKSFSFSQDSGSKVPLTICSDPGTQ